MIKIECDNCEKTFEVEDDMAGGKVPCPMCDDVNRVPEAPTKAKADATTKTAPRSGGEEEEICVIRPGMFRARPFRYMLMVLLILGGLGGAIWGWYTEQNQFLVWLAAVVFAFGLGWFSMWWFSTHFWVKLVITNKRSIRAEGIIKRHTTEVLHDHIRSVDIRQTLMNRMLGIGELDIDSAGQGGESDIEIQMKDVPRPYEVKKIIDQYRRM